LTNSVLANTVNGMATADSTDEVLGIGGMNISVLGDGIVSGSATNITQVGASTVTSAAPV
jgi:hypothetical protein